MRVATGDLCRLSVGKAQVQRHHGVCSGPRPGLAGPQGEEAEVRGEGV